MFKMSAADYISERRAGNITCMEYTTTCVKRMLHYSNLNCFMSTSYAMTDRILAQAEALDARAAAEGIDSIGPLYGLPVPIKGTCATIDFPSCVGVGVLQHCYARKDSELVEILKNAHAVIMGKTNVPEFAASGATLNHANGVTRNPANPKLTPGGSSGGSGAAVAARIVPLAVTEDTGGSTRIPANQVSGSLLCHRHAPTLSELRVETGSKSSCGTDRQIKSVQVCACVGALQCGNFGYDPPRNKYPNGGNPGITFWNDQLGLNAREFDDILLYDAAVTGKVQEHDAASASVAALSNSDITVGFPREFFYECNWPDSVLDNEQINKVRSPKLTVGFSQSSYTVMTYRRRRTTGRAVPTSGLPVDLPLQAFSRSLPPRMRQLRLRGSAFARRIGTASRPRSSEQ